MSKKKAFIILGIVLGLLLLAVAAYLSTAKYAQEKVETLLTAELANLGWDTSNIEIKTIATSPCLNLHTTSPLGSSLTIEDACIKGGLPSLLTKRPDIKLHITKVIATVDVRDIEDLKLRFSAKAAKAGELMLPGAKNNLKLANIGLDVTLVAFEVKVVQKDKKELVTLSVNDAHLRLENGQANANAQIESFVSENLLELVDLKTNERGLDTKNLSFSYLNPHKEDPEALKVYVALNLVKGLGNARLEMGKAKQAMHFKHKTLEGEIALEGMQIEMEEKHIRLSFMGIVLDIPALRIDESLPKTGPPTSEESEQPTPPDKGTIEPIVLDEPEELAFNPNAPDDEDDAGLDKDETEGDGDAKNQHPPPNGVDKSSLEVARFEKLTLDIDRQALLAMLNAKEQTDINKDLLSLILELRLDSPIIQVDAEKLMNSDDFMALPGAKTLMGYWSTSAGSLLGGAPQKSAKFPPDQPKTAVVIRKNPISPEMLAVFRDGFKHLQDKLLALPPINIVDGTIKMYKDGRAFALKALSFKTRDLMTDDQKLHFDFTVGDARASFDVSFAEGSIYPRIQLDVDKLGAESLYKIINMPTPKAADGTFYGSLLLTINDEDLSVDAQLRFEHFAFYHERISPNLVHDIEASAKMKFVYVFNNDLLKIEDVELRSGPIAVRGTMGIENLRSYPVIHLNLAAKDIPCEAIAQAIPPGLLPTITNLRMGGTAISPSLTAKIPWKDPLKLTLKETGFTNDCYPLSVAPHYPDKLNDDGYTFTTNYTYFVDAIEVGPGTRGYTPLKDIPPYVRAAMFLTEDMRFLDHGPLRLSFIERAMRLNLNARKYIYGGSTISQQLVKNLFLDRKKNLARKLEEWFITWHMETVVPKTRIFELYLNMIEFGPDVYGISQAAKFYFGKIPSELTPLEGAYLASLKVAPSKGGRFYYSGFPEKKWWNKRMRYILKILAENGYISMTDALGAYPWIPQFVYPPRENGSDFRNIWLANYAKRSKYKARATH